MCLGHTMEFSPIKKSKVDGKMDGPGDNIKQVSKRQILYVFSHLWLWSFMQAQNHAYTYICIFHTETHIHTHTKWKWKQSWENKSKAVKLFLSQRYHLSCDPSHMMWVTMNILWLGLSVPLSLLLITGIRLATYIIAHPWRTSAVLRFLTWSWTPDCCKDSTLNHGHIP